MEKTSSFAELFKKYWITILIAVQPLLDILAYWTRSPDGTAAGMLRLAIMLILPLHLLITLKDKKRFILSMALIGLAGALHVANCLRVRCKCRFLRSACLIILGTRRRRKPPCGAFCTPGLSILPA